MKRKFPLGAQPKKACLLKSEEDLTVITKTYDLILWSCSTAFSTSAWVSDRLRPRRIRDRRSPHGVAGANVAACLPAEPLD